MYRYSAGAGHKDMPQETKHINFLWCSLAGLRCLRVVPVHTMYDKKRVDQYADIDENGYLKWLPKPMPSVSLSRACISLPAHEDTPSPDSGVPFVGDICLQLEDPMSNLMCLPWRPKHFMGAVRMLDPISHAPWSLCPRSCLARILEKAQARHGISFRVGFELEFALATIDGKFDDRHTYSSARAFDVESSLLDDLCDTLYSMGIVVEQLHKESAPGQFELVLGHLPAMEAVDGLLLAREAVAAVAYRHQRRVTLLPKFLPEYAGNGCHVHLSLWKNGINILSLSGATIRPGSLDGVLDVYTTLSGFSSLNETFRQFLGGLVALLPALMCFTTPTPNSFRRLQPGAWAGAFQGWGIANKEVPLRLPVQTLEDGLFTNVEVKLCDSTANPHIALAAILSAGLVGVDLAATLSEADFAESFAALPAPLDVDPGQLTYAERTRRKIKELPREWSTAKACLMSPEGKGLRELLGEDMVRACVAIRESEWAALGGIRLEEEIDLLFDRY